MSGHRIKVLLLAIVAACAMTVSASAWETDNICRVVKSSVTRADLAVEVAAGATAQIPGAAIPVQGPRAGWYCIKARLTATVRCIGPATVVCVVDPVLTATSSTGCSGFGIFPSGDPWRPDPVLVHGAPAATTVSIDFLGQVFNLSPCPARTDPIQLILQLAVSGPRVAAGKAGPKPTGRLLLRDGLMTVTVYDFPSSGGGLP
jgi:hypothetical protein